MKTTRTSVANMIEASSHKCFSPRPPPLLRQNTILFSISLPKIHNFLRTNGTKAPLQAQDLAQKEISTLKRLHRPSHPLHLRARTASSNSLPLPIRRASARPSALTTSSDSLLLHIRRAPTSALSPTTSASPFEALMALAQQYKEEDEAAARITTTPLTSVPFASARLAPLEEMSEEKLVPRPLRPSTVLRSGGNTSFRAPIEGGFF